MPTYTGIQRSRAVHGTSPDGNGWRDSNAVTVNAALTTADAVVLADIPPGVRLETLRFRNGDLDTGTGTLTVNIGYRSKLPGGTQTALTFFAAASAAFAAPNATWQELVFTPIKFDEPVEIVAIPAANANALAAAATVFVQVEGAVVGIA